MPKCGGDFEMIKGKGGILGSEKGEMLRSCSVWGAGAKPMRLECPGAI